MNPLRPVLLITALAVALILTGGLIAPTIRDRWFAKIEPVQLVIVVLDNARETRPLEMVVHVPGESPWHVKVTPDMPIDAEFFGFYPVGEVHTFGFEILGDRGLAVDVEFRTTEDTDPVDTRNRIEIDVRDDVVTVRGESTTEMSWNRMSK